MQLLRKVASFGISTDELKDIYILFVRSLLEQSAPVWHSSLTQENINYLERVQKSAVRIIMDDKYRGYKKSLNFLDLESLNDKTKDMFPLNFKTHNMDTRYAEKYKVQHANTERLKNSSIIFMQMLLNEHDKKEEHKI